MTRSRTMIRPRRKVIITPPVDPGTPGDGTGGGTYVGTSTGPLGSRLSEIYGGAESGSWLTTKLPANAAIMADGNAARNAILADISKNTPWINRSAYCPTINVVAVDTPYVPVHGDGARFANDNALLQMLTGGVPLPVGLEPASGTDSELVVYMPDWRHSSNPASSGNPPDGCFWELWHARSPSMNAGRTDGVTGWSCSWAGRYTFANKRLDGHYRDVTFNGQGGFGLNPGLPDAHDSAYEKRLWGTQATSIPFIGTTITKRDIAGGKIAHPIQFMTAGVPTANQVGAVWPAQRHDGGSQVGLPQGARLRFPAGMATPAGMDPLSVMIFEAVRDYGLVFTDTATGFILRGEPGMDSVYSDKYGVALSPAETMSQIPWNQLVRLEVGSDTAYTPLAP